ncbi:hypothetical protein B0H63DRAFT_537406 [Podospora didyma]|uniref:NADPH-dependent 1-acyldihydroxyacetone phosphate reductase n=1 Tax=Podospora didyma TaxID=330526 RepID=A0AAE0U3Q4_9PEZI|nr:hypothetical protein B0H63DRAFT_537406 [Podospora didyma]
MPPKTVLVTGASEGGVGNALAIAFQKRGLHVFATARKVSKMANLAKLPNVTLLELDVTSRASIEAAATAIRSLDPALGGGDKLDILVNNSGQSYLAPLMDTPIPTMREIFDVNYFGLVETTQILGALVIAAKGTILNVSSLAAEIHAPWMGTYSASKAAVDKFSETLRLELIPLGVKVITLAMGQVKTNMSSGANVQAPKLSENSLWQVTKEEQARLDAGKKPTGGSSPEAFAKKVVSDVLGGASGRLHRGHIATTISLLFSILPGWAADKFLLFATKGQFELAPRT